MRVERLSSFPWVVARIGCAECPRTGRYRLVRLAAAFGPEALLTAVLYELSKDCPIRLEHAGGHLSTSCAARFIDVTDPNPPLPDLPAPLRGLSVIEGGRAEAPKRVFVPCTERNPRRAYDKDGTETEPGRIGDMVAREGITRVRVFCPAPCWHSSTLDVSDWPGELAIPDIGLRLRCSKCGRHGRATIMPDWPNPIPSSRT